MNFEANVTPSDWTCWTTINNRHSKILWSTSHGGGNKMFKLFVREDLTKEHSQEE